MVKYQNLGISIVFHYLITTHYLLVAIAVTLFFFCSNILVTRAHTIKCEEFGMVIKMVKIADKCG